MSYADLPFGKLLAYSITTANSSAIFPLALSRCRWILKISYSKVREQCKAVTRELETLYAVWMNVFSFVLWNDVHKFARSGWKNRRTISIHRRAYTHIKKWKEKKTWYDVDPCGSLTYLHVCASMRLYALVCHACVCVYVSVCLMNFYTHMYCVDRFLTLPLSFSLCLLF